MLRIALIGYGKMGKTIQKLALDKGHTTPLIVDIDQPGSLKDLNQNIDVAIEFTRPEAAVTNILACAQAGVPVVSGTTGWLENWGMVSEKIQASKSALFYASNYSIGVNIFFALNKWLAGKMKDQIDYRVSMREIHHTEKLDAPSGTAITLAEGIMEKLPQLQRWINAAANDESELEIVSDRIPGVPGTHTVQYESEVDTLKIEHVAHARVGFAQGALIAAEWLVGKQGVFGMQDMLEI